MWTENYIFNNINCEVWSRQWKKKWTKELRPRFVVMCDDAKEWVVNCRSCQRNMQVVESAIRNKAITVNRNSMWFLSNKKKVNHKEKKKMMSCIDQKWGKDGFLSMWRLWALPLSYCTDESEGWNQLTTELFLTNLSLLHFYFTIELVGFV